MLLTQAACARSIAVAGLLAASLPGVARAEPPGDPDKQTCVDEYVSGQRARKAGKLLEAHRRFTVCGHTACPHVYASDCRRWRDEVDASIPGVVFDVRDRNDAAATSVRVTIDGAPLADALDGRAVQVDPGAHSFVFEMSGEPPREVRATVLEGVKAQRIDVSFAARRATAETATSPEVARPIPVAVWILAGAGVAGLAAFTYFGLRANGEESDLRAMCAGTTGCTDAEANAGKDSIRGKQLAADLSLAAGAISLGTAMVLYLIRPASARSTNMTLAPTAGVMHTAGGWRAQTAWTF